MVFIKVFIYLVALYCLIGFFVYAHDRIKEYLKERGQKNV